MNRKTKWSQRILALAIIVLESTILYSGWRVWKTELRPKQKGKVKKIAFK